MNVTNTWVSSNIMSESLSRMMWTNLPACTFHLPNTWMLLHSVHTPGVGSANTVVHTHDETRCTWRPRVELPGSPHKYSPLYQAFHQILACQEENEYQVGQHMEGEGQYQFGLGDRHGARILDSPVGRRFLVEKALRLIPANIVVLNFR